MQLLCGVHARDVGSFPHPHQPPFIIYYHILILHVGFEGIQIPIQRSLQACKYAVLLATRSTLSHL